MISSGEQPSEKKSFMRSTVIILLAAAFALGLYVGRSVDSGQSRSTTQFVNTLTNKPADVNFDLFWKVYDLINEKYVDRPTDKQKILYGAIDGMVKSLGDPYTAFMTPDMTKSFQSEISGTFEGIGIEIGLKDNAITIITPIQNSPGQKAGLQAGDAILKIGDKPTTDLGLDDAVGLIRGAKGTSVHLTIHRGKEDKVREFTITRDTISVKSVEFSDKGNGLFYIKISRFGEDTSKDFDNAVSEFQKAGAKKLILDVRNNPGGFLDSAIDIASEFIEKGVVVSEAFNKDKKIDHMALGNARLKEVPVVVLVNGGSASASEILAGALHDDLGSKLVGQKTFGKGSVQEFSDLSGGASIRVTIAKWLTPKGVNIHGNGIEPDIKVEITDDNYKNNQDPQLDKAIELLK